jgi:hypothetical protein
VSELLPQLPSIDTAPVLAAVGDAPEVEVWVDVELLSLDEPPHFPKPLWHPVPQ